MTKRLEDIQEITELCARYGTGAGALNANQQGSCFIENGTYGGLTEMVGQGDTPLAGRAEIIRFLGSTHDTLEYLHQVQLVHDIVIDGDRATSNTEIVEYAKLKDGPLLLSMGLLADEYLREGGRWLYSNRHFSSKRVATLTESPLAFG